jgi:hypothetical protein
MAKPRDDNILFSDLYFSSLDLMQRTINNAVKHGESEGLRWLDQSTKAMMQKGLRSLNADKRRNLMGVTF